MRNLAQPPRQHIGIRYRVIEVGWLVPLVRDYGVSTRWLITGQGEMFGEEKQPPQ